MDPRSFNRLSRIVYEKSGIHLKEGKEAMATARIAKRMRALNISTHREYLHHLLNDDTGTEIVQLLDVISTNVTSFFRESHHFSFLASALRKWRANGQTRFRIWSAACATGEEPYSIGMTVLDALNDTNLDVRILATDISTRALQHARHGIYDKEHTKNIPVHLKHKYLDINRKEGALQFTVKDCVKRLILFRRLNLSSTPYPMHGPLDFVFCRNVMIYFDTTMCKRLITEVERLLKPGGYFLVGHAESMICRNSNLRMFKPSIYVKDDSSS